MIDALPGPQPRPRPLPSDEPLAPEDYRRLIGVLEAIDHAADLTEFRERLIRALQTWFGFHGIAVMHGADLAEAVASDCGVLSGYSPEFLTEYQARWIGHDPFRSKHAFDLLMRRGVLRLGDLDDQAGFVARFLRRHGITDKAAMVIDAEQAGIVYVGVAVQDVPRVSERDLTILRLLRRHLAPHAAEQLTRQREQRTARADWKLTPREWDVADLAAQGMTNRQIADRLFVTVDTVKKHLTRVLATTGCASRTQLALLYASTA
ncbi:helix-turn-helix transcriptional regulator [Nonomuraea sp. CA-141351]|uniref:helix-turn-helix transcriptional regulator n=1 Tax=Nonomuraea sp. CA-141351 TaxID=3239996 RepID=UPI003D94AA69